MPCTLEIGGRKMCDHSKVQYGRCLECGDVVDQAAADELAAVVEFPEEPAPELPEGPGEAIGEG